MRTGRVLTAAGALLAVVVIAACGSSNQVPPAGSGNTGSATTPSPGNTTSTPQPNSAYPYEPGGVTYRGVGAQVDTFSIPAGTYSMNQRASYDPANDPNGTGSCVFGGELDYLSGSGGTTTLGNNNAPIVAMVPFEDPAVAGTYAAGNYRLYIVPGTTCSWLFQLQN